MAAMGGTAEQLQEHSQSFNQRWQEVKSAWDDAYRRKFEGTYIEPLESHTQAALHTMQELATVIEESHRRIESTRRSGS